MPFDGLLPDENPAVRVIDLMIDGFREGKYWVKGAYRSYARRCLWQAMVDVRRQYRIPDNKAGRFIAKAIREGTSHRGIIEFNDADETTFTDVQRVLLRARALAALGPASGKTCGRRGRGGRINDDRQLMLPSVYGPSKICSGKAIAAAYDMLAR
jgi:hypothetical protein